MLRLMISMLLLGTGLLNNCQAEDLFINRTDQPGILFEQIKELKFVEETWTFNIVINYDSSRYNFTRLNKILSFIRETLTVYKETSCKDKFRVEYLQNKLSEVVISFEKIAQEIDVPQNLNSSEMEYYISQGNLLNEHGSKIVTNIPLRSTTLESSLSEIDESFRNKENRLNAIYKQMLFLKKTNEMRPNNMILFDAMNVIESMLFSIGSKPKEIINNINTLKNNNIPPSLISKNCINSMINHVEEHIKPKGFPMTKESASIEYLTSIGNLKYGREKKRAFVEVNLPVVYEEPSKFYEIKTFPIPEIIFNNKLVYAYIKPASRYFLVKNNHYYNFRETELKNCKETPDYYICPKQWFVLDNKTSCEQELFVNNTYINFKQCDIAYSSKIASNIFRISGTNNWIFSTHQALPLKLKCENKEERDFILQGVGIFSFANHCIVKYLDNNLEIDSTLQNEKTFIIPNINLRLNTLTNIFENLDNRQRLILLIKEGNENSFWRLINYLKLIESNDNEHFIITTVLAIALAFICIIMITLYTVIQFLQSNAREKQPNVSGVQFSNRKGIQENKEPIYDTPLLTGVKIYF